MLALVFVRGVSLDRPYPALRIGDNVAFAPVNLFVAAKAARNSALRAACSPPTTRRAPIRFGLRKSKIKTDSEMSKHAQSVGRLYD